MLSSCLPERSGENLSLASQLKREPLSVSAARAESDLQNVMAKSCQTFSLTSVQIADYFRLADPVSERELHDDPELLVAPCAMTGVLLIAGQEYQFRITASAVARVWRQDEALALVCGTSCNDLFRLP